jgi:hypothetical protein
VEGDRSEGDGNAAAGLDHATTDRGQSSESQFDAHRRRLHAERVAAALWHE